MNQKFRLGNLVTGAGGGAIEFPRLELLLYDFLSTVHRLTERTGLRKKSLNK